MHSRQLEIYLRSKLQELAGDYPKIHRIRTLVENLAEFAGKECKRIIEDFLGKNDFLFSALQDAYITSRYFESALESTQVGVIIEKVTALISAIENVC